MRSYSPPVKAQQYQDRRVRRETGTCRFSRTSKVDEDGAFRRFLERLDLCEVEGDFLLVVWVGVVEGYLELGTLSGKSLVLSEDTILPFDRVCSGVETAVNGLCLG